MRLNGNLQFKMSAGSTKDEQKYVIKASVKGGYCWMELSECNL